MAISRFRLSVAPLVLAGLVGVACGDGGDSTDAPPPSLASLPIVAAPGSTSSTVAAPPPSNTNSLPTGTFCEDYRSLEQRFQQQDAGESLDTARQRFDAVVESAEAIVPDVPPALRDDYGVILSGFQQIAALAAEARSIEELQTAAVAGLDVAAFDQAGRAIEEWAQANC